MNQEMTERIAETKELVTAAEWREKILACQESEKPVRLRSGKTGTASAGSSLPRA